ncbi:class I SAM-dependent methyltransferase [Atopobacter sp. AH10]|uniref:tRNA (mnm(5)s(2)U34)-methyltransferase n=1 Tax=Atopobacter sp. AH10 TaxID=2315861 RepID=UPI0013140DF6|nr:class I SAM-dependent methyltransferase [Atopobacter sp. AH10]
MSTIRPLDLSHLLLQSILSEKDWAIDATVGRGYDTSFLCHLLPKGRLFAFDIQKDALDQAKDRVKNVSTTIDWIEDSHANFSSYLAPYEGQIAAIVYNLGYLPGGDKAITTTVASTLESVAQGLHLLRSGGLMTIMVYPGHPEGAREKDALISYCRTLSQDKVDVYCYQALNQMNQPAFLLALQKK